MPDILIRGLDRQVIKRLRDRAKQNGRSLQSEAKMILEARAGQLTPEDIRANFDKWQKEFAGGTFSSSADLIPEDRDR